MERNRFGTWVLPLVAAVLMMGVGLLGVSAQDATPAAVPEGEVVREVLAAGTPTAAPADALALVRYTIPANLALPAHTHPGMQVSTVESGTLLYTVVAGEAYLTRAGSDTSEVITPESGEVAIEPGDALVEPAGMIHFGRNGSDTPIVLVTASLLEADEPAALLEATPAA